MPRPLRIDFISDVSCVWCVIGWKSMEQALARIGDEVAVELRFLPFELNPDMPPGGENLTDHLARKYGSSPAQVARSREMLRARGEAVGIGIDLGEESRIYNTFDAHRLLHWAYLEGRQRALKDALFTAHFTHGRDPGDHDLLVDLAAGAGLDPERAREILSTGEYADEVRRLEREKLDRGVTSVPTIVFDDESAIVGGQPPEIFEKAIRQIAAARAQG
jgi:predicted DsbA family dithiol-disulfide isomerase